MSGYLLNQALRKEHPVIGKNIAHYQIAEKIGAGGMGVVYRARDAHLGRDVAIKVLPPGALADEAARKRFRKEAQALSKLNHPNIETVHDFDTQEGLDFLVMEYVAGVTLSDRLAGGALPEKDVARLGAQLAEGLAAAHEHGVVHRDLKPANLRITPDGRIKILDFGLAKLLNPASDPEVTRSVTETPSGAGTLPYMSPEQLQGQPVDERADLYAAGAVLYEMATGQRAFRELHGPRLIAAILQEAPAAPGAVNRRVSAELERIILKCLEKDPARRYQSARELRVDLERLAAPTAVTSLSQRGWIRRRKKLILAAAAVVVLGVGAGAYLLLTSNKQIDSLAVLPFVNASGNPDMEYLSDGITDSVRNKLAQLPGLRVTSRSSAFRFKERKAEPNEAAKELGVRAVITGRTQQRGDTLIVGAELVDARRDAQLWGEQYTRKSSDIFALQDEITLDISRQLQRHLTGEEQKRLTRRETQNADAYQLYLKGRHQLNLATKDGFAESLAYFNQAIALDPNFTLAYSGIADSYFMASNLWMHPREAMPKSKAAAQRALGLDESLAEAHSSLGYALGLYDWNWPEAEKHFRRSIELNPNYADARLGYGVLLSYMARFDEGMAQLEVARRLDPLSPFVSSYTIFLLYFARRYAEAETRLRSLIAADPEFFLPHAFLGLVLEQMGKLPEAAAELEKASQAKDAPLEALAQLGHVYALAGRSADARRILKSVEEQASARFTSVYNIAMLYLALGDLDQAFFWFNKFPQDKSEWFATLKVDPRLDKVRDDPRFKELLRRVGLPQ